MRAPTGTPFYTLADCDSCQLSWEHEHPACRQPGCAGAIYQRRQDDDPTLVLKACTGRHCDSCGHGVDLGISSDLCPLCFWIQERDGMARRIVTIDREVRGLLAQRDLAAQRQIESDEALEALAQQPAASAAERIAA